MAANGYTPSFTLPAEISTDNTTTEVVQQQTFLDGSSSQEVGAFFVPPSATITEHGMDISHFFERPILVTSWEWDDGSDFFQTLSPWYSYFTADAIRPKLLGFSRLTADLEVEFRLNGSPFRFSQLLSSYRPLFNSQKTTSTGPRSLSDYSGGYLPEDGCSIAGTSLAAATGSSDYSILARSQRQCCYMDIAKSEGCKMILPFIHPFNALRVNAMPTSDALRASSLFGQELYSMGTIMVESLSTLRNMQTSTTAGVTIDVFVRAVNARAWLSSGVATVEPQGSERLPSQSASSVATTASFFKKVPVIGSYATLAETLATAGGKLLEFFGYTPRPDTTLPQYVTGYSYPVESSVTFPKKVRNLGLDHNNTLVVDPAVVAGSSEDQLAFTSFCAHPTLLFRTYFGSSVGVNDSIAFLPVSPFHYRSSLVTDPDAPNMRRVQMTPASLAAVNFRYWRGTMCVRFHVIKTQFHRGRLRVTWEPELGDSKGTAIATTSTVHEGYQQMLNWDLSASDSLTVKVGFGSRKGRLTVPRLGVPGLTDNTFITNTEASPTTIGNASITLDNYEDYFNGFLRLSVLNKLQAPDVSYPLPIMVHVWYEDMEFYDPLENGPTLSTFASIDPISSTLPTSTSSYYGTVFSSEDVENLMTRRLVYDTLYPQGVDDEDLPPVILTLLAQGDEEFTFQPTTTVEDAVYEGEKVGSLRSLLQRDVYYDTLEFEIPRNTAQPSIASSLTSMSVDTPPTLVTAILPMYPHPFGTTSPLRSTSQTINVTNPGYEFTGTGGTVRTFYPNMARTNLFPLLRECFIGFRGSYNWKFIPLAESGTRVSMMSASRANFTHGSYNRVGSIPRNIRVAPFSTTPEYTTNGPSFSGSETSLIAPIIYDTGGCTTGVNLGFRNVYLNASNKLTSIRRFFNSYFGSCASGTLVVDTKEQRTLGIRMPYFSSARFFPGSTTGWMNGNSNAELAQNIRFTALTEGSPRSMIGGFTYAASGGTAASNTNTTTINGPIRAFVAFAAICSAGDDISFGGFVSVPALYLTSASVFTDSSNDNT